VIDPQDSNLIIFDLESHIPTVPHQLEFQILVFFKTRRVFGIVVDKGDSTCIISISCWKDLASPTINQSPGRGFRPYGILNEFPIKLEGKMVAIEVEFVDPKLHYNLFLG